MYIYMYIYAHIYMSSIVVVRHPSSVVRHPSFVVRRHPSSSTRRLSVTFASSVRRPSFVVRRQSSVDEVVRQSICLWQSVPIRVAERSVELCGVPAHSRKRLRKGVQLVHANCSCDQ